MEACYTIIKTKHDAVVEKLGYPHVQNKLSDIPLVLVTYPN